jgi:hypothetical protein
MRVEKGGKKDVSNYEPLSSTDLYQPSVLLFF